MPGDWSQQEVAATVADYLDMLGHELRGEPFSKREHNRHLQALLNDRSAGAIEFKHQNISAILIELGFPYIDGYKPRANYQDRLRAEVLRRLAANPALIEAAEQLVTAPVDAPAPHVGIDGLIVPPPVPDRPDRVYERRVLPAPPQLGINYLEREARNAALGKAGEEFVLNLEHRRLWEAGAKHLADRIEHSARTRGDGLGYDIRSFETNGRERLIEVKTTAFGMMTPFFASAREVTVSAERADAFHLYRLFRFRTDPKVFILPGSLRSTCRLDPVEYRASLS